MIDYIKGEVADLTPATVTIDCNGAKTAQRIIVDLKDKIKFSDEGQLTNLAKVAAPALEHEAVAALVMLGFPQVKSQKVVKTVIKEIPGSTVEAIIKESLKRL